MNNFKEFVDSNYNEKGIGDKKNISLLSRKLTEAISPILLKSSIRVNKRDKFQSEVVRVVNSDGVLTELNESIGEPKEAESEDEFVARAKSVLANILERKLLK